MTSMINIFGCLLGSRLAGSLSACLRGRLQSTEAAQGTSAGPPVAHVKKMKALNALSTPQLLLDHRYDDIDMYLKRRFER
jgi:hypothetical protein